MPELIDIIMPEDQQEGTESVVGQWFKQPGDPVTQHEPLLEINTDKVVVEIPCPATGTLAECAVRAGEPVQPGQLLGRIQTDEAKPVAKPPVTEPTSVQPSRSPAPPAQLRLSPAVRRLLQEHDVDLSAIRGTGRGGRITHRDVVQFLAGVPAGPTAEPASGPDRAIPHSPMRKAIAQHMLQSVQTAPHVTAVFEADLSAVILDRKRRRDEFQARGARLTYTAYFVAAAAQALTQVPEVNSTWKEDELQIYGDCNIGVAVALERRGLLVPVVKQAQKRSLFDIASRLQQLTQLAQQGKLDSSDLEGGTFTITNHGTSGSLIATPIIHQPQSAILGIGKIEKRIQVDEDETGLSLRVSPKAYVTLTIDHRALDGFTANLFLQHFVDNLQGPLR